MLRFLLLLGAVLSAYATACEDGTTPVFSCALEDESEVTLCAVDNDHLRFRIRTKDGHTSAQDFAVGESDHFIQPVLAARGLILSNDVFVVMIAQQNLQKALPKTIIKMRGWQDDGITLVCAAGSDSDLTPALLQRYGGTAVELPLPDEGSID